MFVARPRSAAANSTWCVKFDSSVYVMSSLIFALFFMTVHPQRTAADPQTAPQFAFHEDTSRHVNILSGKLMLTGRLDRNGNFYIEFSLRAGAAASGVPPSELINGSNLVGKKVYEFRSRRLVKGEIMKDGRFVPDFNSEVLDFKDYKYAPDGIRIYNLPGHFWEVKPMGDKKQ